jgi:DNA-binding CsgD family transcriptional regulator
MTTTGRARPAAGGPTHHLTATAARGRSRTFRPYTGAVTGITVTRRAEDAGLALALDLADTQTLRAATGAALPLLAALSGAPVVVFAVAGTLAAGARCWPEAPDWSSAFEAKLTSAWENGPLTAYCRAAGVVPPFRIEPLLRDLGWDGLPLSTPGGQQLRYAAYVAVAATTTMIGGYFVARVDRPISDDELAGLSRLQPALVASHGRFLRAIDPSVRLTARQQQILGLMQGGLTAGAIASRLGISESTVGKHLRDLYARLDAHDRVSAIREARARGLLDGVGGENWQDVLMP